MLSQPPGWLDVVAIAVVLVVCTRPPRTRLMDHPASAALATLTEREREVLRLVAGATATPRSAAGCSSAKRR